MDTVLSGSNGIDFLVGSDVAFPNCPEAILGDFAGVAGFSIRDCLAGVFFTGISSDAPSVMEGLELGRTCSGFTSGTAVTVGVLFG